jgi:hypothetical protein
MALAAPGAASADEISVRTVDRTEKCGSLGAWSLGSGLRFSVADGSTETIATSEIITIMRTQEPARLPDGGHLVLLCDGGRLNGELAEVAEERLVLLHAVLGRFTIPLEDVLAIVAPGARDRMGDVLAARLQPRPGADELPAQLEDEFWFANGERIHGTLLEIDENNLRMESDAGPSQTPAEYLLAVALANPPYKPPAGVGAMLHLADGSDLRVSRLEWVSETIQAAAPGLGEFSLPASQLLSAEVVGGRWQWLDRMVPAAYEHHSLTGRTRPYAVGHNAVGQPLRLAAAVHEHGIGLRSASRVRFALAGQFETFTGLLGLDDSAAPYGDAHVAILVDGTPAFEAGSLRAGAPPQPLRIDTRGAATLDIVVDFGENADVQDWVNVVDAALIRRK